MDRAWWRVNIRAVQETFEGHLATILLGCFNVERFVIPERNNSGAGAVELAIQLGAKTIILTGYDMQHTDGKKHWHPDHPEPLKNAGAVCKWPEEFERIKARYPDVKIINSTRETALKMFERIPLEKALNEFY